MNNVIVKMSDDITFFLIHVGDKSVWKEILEMKDPVHMRYQVIEELFCQQKKEDKPDQDKQKKRQSTQVSTVVFVAC